MFSINLAELQKGYETEIAKNAAKKLVIENQEQGEQDQVVQRQSTMGRQSMMGNVRSSNSRFDFNT